jgi:hypothetical protein
MTQLVEYNGVHVNIVADLPQLVIVQMKVASQRLGIRRRRVKGMCQDATRAIKGVGVPMFPRCEQQG